MTSSLPKIDYTAFKLTKINFRDNEKTNTFIWLIRKLMGTEERISPVISPSQTSTLHIKTREKRKSILILGEAVGLDKFISTDLLQYHQDRLDREDTIGFNIYMLIALILYFAPVALLLISLLARIRSNTFSPFLILLIILFSIVLVLYVFVAAGIAARFSHFVTFRYFSDSLCIETLIFLIVELARCSNPMTQSEKKRLLLRTNFLAKATRFLIYQYNLDTGILDWVTNHFRQIEFFIREREKWIIAPKDSTLADLQQDFYKLTLIYTSGNFGNFEDETSVPSSIAVISNNRFKNFLLGIPRISIGIVLPLSVLLIISIRPELISNLIDIKVLTLICIGWLLLAIDVILKLGIVSSVIEVAKGLKELT